MSDPVRKHVIDPRVGTTYVSARYAQMRCDGTPIIGNWCLLPPTRAPRVVVGAKPWQPGFSPPPLKMMTTLHYCQRHLDQVKDILLGEILTGKVKAAFEASARRRNWPLDYKPDFDGAFIEWVLVSTPEYRRFLSGLELNLREHSEAPLL